MRQEFVLAKIGFRRARVYCRFVFRNEGEGTKIRVGFPDGNDHDGEYPDMKPKPSLRNFRSAIDGQAISTHVMVGKDFPFFHVKTIAFRRHQTRVVEDWYDLPLNGSATGTPGYSIHGFSYTMRTGGSWYGLIGRAIVRISWHSPEMRHPKLVPIEKFGDPGESKAWDRLPRNLVIFTGFSIPRVSRNSVTFGATTLSPMRDRIFIYRSARIEFCPLCGSFTRNP